MMCVCLSNPMNSGILQICESTEWYLYLKSFQELGVAGSLRTCPCNALFGGSMKDLDHLFTADFLKMCI